MSFNRPPPASWDQSGPTQIWRGEVSQIFSSSLFATASYSAVSTGFTLTPEGGTDVNDLYINPQGQFIGSYLFAETNRPQKQAAANGSYFFNTGSVGHEVKFGFNYRQTDVDSLSSWPGNGNYGDLADFPQPVAVMTRDAVLNTSLRYYSGYVSDTLTFGNLTVNAGVRYDNQQGHNLASTTPANPVIPDLLPGITTPNEPAAFTWENVVPRIGATYALGQEHKTLLRASYSQYADQLGAGAIAFNNPGALSGIYYYWNDVNNDHVITRNELNLNQVVSHYGVDPNNPGSAISPNTIDPNLKAGKTSEITGGIEQELSDGLVVGLTYTYRKYTGALWPQRTGLTESDYEVGGTLSGVLFNGVPFNIPYYQLDPGVAVPAGLTLTNRPDWDTTYNGLDLTFQKRLSDRWLVRGSANLAELEPAWRCGLVLRPDERPRRQQRALARHADRHPDRLDLRGQRHRRASGRIRERRAQRGLPELALDVQRRRSVSAAGGLRGRRELLRTRRVSVHQLLPVRPGRRPGTPRQHHHVARPVPLRRRLRARFEAREGHHGQAPRDHAFGGRLQRGQLGHRSPAQRARGPRPGGVRPDHRDAESPRRAVRRAAVLLGTALRSRGRRVQRPAGLALSGTTRAGAVARYGS